eukprot:TRINITY_DN27757_c0_g1_i2.p1 TRINITY_DN27757_c0_g1~~TRINITY_DN27757_c0_g1_i2.p1  ORF type:complete len:498 (+),score=84.03 TRINITY_DN27757_c0_g1_i2:107-1600(+)
MRGQLPTARRLAACKTVAEVVTALSAAETLRVQWNEVILATAAHRAARAAIRRSASYQERRDAKAIVGWLASVHHRASPGRWRNPQSAANLLWAAAAVSAAERANGAFDAVAAAAEHFAPRWRPQERANAVWAYATALLRDERVFDAVDAAASGEGEVAAFKHQELANTVWAYAVVRAADGDGKLLATAAARVCSEGLALYSEQHFATILWAFATVRHRELPRLAHSAVCALKTRGFGDFTWQGLANTAWALAHGAEAASALLAAEELCLRCGHGLPVREASNLSWALAATLADGANAPGLALRLCAGIVSDGPAAPHEVVRTAWAAAAAALDDPTCPTVSALFRQVLAVAESGFAECGAQDCANAAWACAVVVQPALPQALPTEGPRRVCEAAAARACEMGVGEFDTRGLVALLWACADVNAEASAFVEAAHARFCSDTTADLDEKQLCTVLWAMAQLRNNAPASGFERLGQVRDITLRPAAGPAKLSSPQRASCT